ESRPAPASAEEVRHRPRSDALCRNGTRHSLHLHLISHRQVRHRNGLLGDNLSRIGYLDRLRVAAELALNGDDARIQVATGNGAHHEGHSAPRAALTGKTASLELAAGAASRKSSRTALPAWKAALPSLAKLLAEGQRSDCQNGANHENHPENVNVQFTS